MNFVLAKKIEKSIFYIFLFSLPFSIKKFLFSLHPPLGGDFSFFLYLADVLFFLLLIFWLWRVVLQREKIKIDKIDLVFLFLVFWVFLSSLWSLNPLFSLIFGLRLFLFFLLVLYLKNNLKNFSFKSSLFIIFCSLIIESLIATLQFFNQASLGLRILGEPIFSPLVLGAAKFSVFGVKFVRPPGTLAHANILAAFLVFGLVFSFALFEAVYQKPSKNKIFLLTTYFLADFILFLALLLTFSRSGWLVFFVGFVGFFGWLVFFGNMKKKNYIVLLVFLILVGLISLFIFKDFIFVRTHINLQEKAINLRLVYQKIAFSLFEKAPLLGVGFGNYLLAVKKFDLWQKFGINFSYLYQPVHNIYLLWLSETGLVGLFGFLLLNLLVLKKAFLKILREKGNLYLLAAFLIQIGFLLWGLSDHFFYDLVLGRYLFWLSFGFLSFLALS